MDRPNSFPTQTKSNEALNDYLKKCDCEKLINELSSELTESDRVLIKMLHKKCAVISRAKNEMESLDGKFNKHMEELKNCRFLSRKRRTYVMLILIIGILLTGWFFIIYGVILGSLICSKMSINCRILETLILRVPGLSWSSDGNERQYRVY